MYFGCSRKLEQDLGTKIYKKGFSTNYIEFIDVYKNDKEIYVKTRYKNNYRYFVGNITNIKYYNTYLDTTEAIKESIKYTTKHNNCIINDVARPLTDGHGYAVK